MNDRQAEALEVLKELRDKADDQSRYEIVRQALEQNQCPHIRTSDEGTSWCALAEQGRVPDGISYYQWPPRSIVQKLSDAANVLLDEFDYDGHGHEEFFIAQELAATWLAVEPEQDDEL